MRNILVFTMSVAVLLWAACSGADKKELLIGKWDYQSWNLNGDITEAKEMNAPFMEFKNDGSYILTAGAAVKQAEWELKGDTIIVKDEGPQHKMVITELNKEKLVLESVTGTLKTIITLVPSTRPDNADGMTLEEKRKAFKDANKHIPRSAEEQAHDDHDHSDPNHTH